MTLNSPSKINQNNGTNDIIIDLPFISAQIISIAANQIGHSYVQVLAINIFLLLSAKLAFVLVNKIKK